jgi:serine/threonine protein kinase
MQEGSRPRAGHMSNIDTHCPLEGEAPAPCTIIPEETIPSTLPEQIFHQFVVNTSRSHGPSVARPARSSSVARVAGVLRRGALVDKYQIEEVLGVGGFAVVYRAIHLLLRNSVAIKLLRQDVLIAQPTMRTYLLDEARLAARINHPNVVRIYDATHSEHLTYIVMEFIDGSSLSRRIDHGPLDVVSTLRMGLDIGAGLRAGLKQDLIHRDVKPANILISREGVAKLIDFGMAHEPYGAAPLASLGRPQVVGTRGYMAPEQSVDSTRVDFRADIYSLGVTLLEAAMGTRRPTSAPEIAATLPTAFTDLVRWMRSPAPDMRPASYEVLINQMQHILKTVEAASQSD